MSDQRSSYRQIFKSTSIFGGVQFFQIIIAIVRSKLVAILLGAQGMGISGLFVSVIALITGVTGLGLNMSAVRNISESNQSGDEARISRTVAIVKKLALLTGALGTVFTLVLSPWLSKITFGDYTFTWAFVALSFTFILTSLAGSQSVLLQGLRKLSYLAKSSILGATAGLLVSIPLYYIYGNNGIVPAIILSAIATTVLAYYFGSKVPVQQQAVSFSEAWREGNGMIRMGIMLSLGSIIAAVAAYAVRLFINWQGNLVDVGLYSAGFAIINTYVGMIFTAMATDYYPRLSGVATDRDKANKLVNQQAEMALLILGPILILFLILLKFAITVLYTTEFLASESMIQWAAIAIFLKAMTWSMGFLILAKNDSKVFFVNELVVNIYTFGLNLLGYSYWGLEGLGISFLVAYLLASIQNIVLMATKYSFSFNSKIYFLVLGYSLTGVIYLFIDRTLIVSGDFKTMISVTLWMIVMVYSLNELNKILDLKDFLKKLKSKVS